MLVTYSFQRTDNLVVCIHVLKKCIIVRSIPSLVDTAAIPAETLSDAPKATVHGGYLGGLDFGWNPPWMDRWARTRWYNRLALGYFDARLSALDCQGTTNRMSCVIRAVKEGNGLKLDSNSAAEHVILNGCAARLQRSKPERDRGGDKRRMLFLLCTSHLQSRPHPRGRAVKFTLAL